MFEHVQRAPHPGLRGVVRRHGGFTERDPTARRELPSGDVVVILDLGSGWELPELGERYGSFAAGLDDRATLVALPGHARCLQVDLTPFGARALLGVPSASRRRRGSSGCSRRQLSVRFREEVGVAPKVFARLVRFRARGAAHRRATARSAPSPA